MRIAALILSLFSFLLIWSVITGSGSPDSSRRQGHRHVMDKPEDWIEVFEAPDREEWQETARVIEMMKVKKGDVIADIGAGSGYFTRHFAGAVGPEGLAIGVDIEPALIKYMEEDARRLGLKSYKPRLATMENSGLEPESVDIIFICLTYHHIDHRPDYMRNLLKVLRTGGRVIFVEFYKKKIRVGPPPNHKVSKETVISEMKEAGYRLTRSLDFLRYQYFLEFEPI